MASTFSGFTSLIFNANPTNSLRFVGSVRTDHYQVPNTRQQQDLGIRDREIATDSFANFNWVHTWSSGALLTVSPYYHFNRGHYIGGKNDPIVTTDDRRSNYLGGYVNLAITKERHTVRFGTDAFTEFNHSLFGLALNDGNGIAVAHHENLTAHVTSLFADDSYRVTPWLTLNNGLRFEHFLGTLTEHSVSPRLGAAINIPHFAVLRGSYNRYYQHPQVSTIGGPILEFAARHGFDFLPIPGERDEIWEVGIAIPIYGWVLDFDRFHNKTRNAVDHQVLGNSSLLLPLTIERGRVRAYESTLRSPLLFHRLQLHYALSFQTVQGRGGITVD